MQKFKTLSTSRPVMFIGGAVLALGLIWPRIGAAQDKTDDAAKDPDAHAQHKDEQPPGDQTLAGQIAELRAKVAKLEAALKQDHKGMPSGSPDKGGLAGTQDKTGGDPADRGTNQDDKAGAAAKKPAGGTGMMGGKGMGMMAEKKAAGIAMMDMDKKKGMGEMGGDKGGMMDQQMMQMMQMMQQMMEMKMMEMKMGKGMGSGMPDMKDTQPPGMKGMEMGTKGMEMGMKGREMMGGKGMAGMQTPAALPAFPGTSHIYHIGATGFFLDHPEHIKLTTEQETALNQAKEKSLLEQASFQRKIDDAEQELGTLTSSDKPDANKIDAKVRAIEKLRSDQRLAFIRSVGEAAEVLTDEQRQSLSGDAKPQEHQHNPAPTK